MYLFNLDFCPRHRHLHLCRDGHAALRRRLLQERLREVGLRHAEVELYRLLSQVGESIKRLFIRN